MKEKMKERKKRKRRKEKQKRMEIEEGWRVIVSQRATLKKVCTSVNINIQNIPSKHTFVTKDWIIQILPKLYGKCLLLENLLMDFHLIL